MIQHPGEILLEKYLQPLNLSKLQLSYDLRLPYSRIHEICEKRRGITVDTAMRLAKYFGTTAESWIMAQARYDIENMSQEKKNEINKIGTYHV